MGHVVLLVTVGKSLNLSASIVAKVNRDRAIQKLRKEHNLGSGYPSDRKTINFVSNYISNNKVIPSFVRKSWKPVKKMIDN